jgi:hypothetical protein
LLWVVELPGLSGYESYDPAWHKETLAQLREEAATYLQDTIGRLQVSGAPVSHMVRSRPTND